MKIDNYVALDIGNVLMHVDFNVFTSALSKQLNITLEEAEYFMNRTHALHDIGLTKMADELRDHFRIRSPAIIADLLDRWNYVISRNASIIGLIHDMCEQNHLQVAILSNIGLEHSQQLSVKLGTLFDQSVQHLSCCVGARKPTKLYYQSFLMQHPEFYGCAYLDDLPENLQTGQQFGFRPFHFSLQQEVGLGEIHVKREKLEQIRQFILQK
jgi:FMN phosphatase YigB (HAD superfamily)